MTYKGTVKDGVVVLEPGARLAEGLIVEVRAAEERPASLAERLKGVIGIAKGLPADMAQNHDHYIHGTPKRDQP